MSEQIPSTLVTLTVFNTSVAIYSNDLTRTKKHDIKKHKNILNNKKHNKKILKNVKKIFKKHKTCFYTFIKKT